MHGTVVLLEKISAISWRLHAPALLVQVLPQKSNMLPDLSASVLLNQTHTRGPSVARMQDF